jgi:1-acyl-sn-glycerol-3-phosphate acyltransferase
MGIGAHLCLAVPYLRRAHGLGRLDPGERYLFVSNHVSLLDTILLGSLFWRMDCYPVLVLGDKSVWHASRLRKALSGPIGFLLERGRLNPGRIRELQTFGRAAGEFHLLVFPEGTRGDGVHVAPCQPGLFFIAQEAQVPIVPIFIENMHCVSTKTGSFHPIGGLKKVEVHFGLPVAPEQYLEMKREDFGEFIRRQLLALRPAPQAAHLNPVLPQA